MQYPRGTDIASALKYMYQNKYGIDTETLSGVRSVFDVILLAEIKAAEDKHVRLTGGLVDKINQLGDYYATAKKQPVEPIIEAPKVEEQTQSSLVEERMPQSRRDRRQNRQSSLVETETIMREENS